MLNPILLITPLPLKEESWGSYCLRLCEKNQLSSPRMIFTLYKEQIHHPINKYLNSRVLSNSTGHSETTFKNLIAHRKSRNRYQYRDNELPYQMFNFIRSWICIDCVKEKGYSDPAWDLLGLRACHKHKIYFTNRCDNCNKPLTLYRPSIRNCSCGFDLVNSKKIHIEETHAEACEMIYNMFHQNKTDLISNTGLPTHIINKLNLEDCLILFHSIGALYHSVYIAKFRTRSMTSIDEVYSGSIALSNWPLNFHKLIEDYMDLFLDESKVISVQDLILLRAISQKIEPKTRLTLQSEALRVLSLKRNLHQSNIYYQVKDSHLNHVSITQYSNLIAVKPSLIREWIKNGVVPIFHDNTLSPSKVDIKIKVNDHLPCYSGVTYKRRMAATYIGIPPIVLKELRENGIFHISYRTNPPGEYAITDLDNFKSHILSKQKEIVDSDIELMKLEHIFQKRFNLNNAKFLIVSNIFLGNINIYGSSSQIPHLYVSISELLFAIPELNFDITNLSAKEASRILDLPEWTVKQLARANFLQTGDSTKFLVTKESVENFKNTFTKTSKIKLDHNISRSDFTRLLSLLCIKPIAIQSSIRKNQDISYSYFIKYSEYQLLLKHLNTSTSFIGD